MKFVNYDIVFQEIPDETTLAINISNCPIGCPDCHSKYLWDDIGEPLTQDSLGGLLNKYGGGITCVALMGGDATPDKIFRCAAWIKEQFGLKVAWYSGNSAIHSATPLHLFDYIKVGPYIKACGDLKTKTTNQRLYHVRQENDGRSTLNDITNIFWQ